MKGELLPACRRRNPQGEPTATQDLSRLADIAEASGANSGERSKLYCLSFSDFQSRYTDYTAFYDAEKFMVSLQGLVNREKPQLYVVDHDSQPWLNFLRRDSAQILYGLEKEPITSIEALCDAFADEIKARGLVLWSLDVPVTSNVAATVCGCDGYLPVLYDTGEDSLYTLLTTKYGAEVRLDLCGRFNGSGLIWDTELPSSGSVKCDAYLWAIEKYVKTDKTSKDYLGYMTDAYPLTLGKTAPYLDNSVYETYLPDQDFLIAKGAFLFDLDVWGDEVPCDDPGQPVGTDYALFRQILQLQYDRNRGAFSQCIGFPPFPYKYCQGTGEGQNHDATACEFECVELCTAYNVAVAADCPGPSSLHNCSVYMHHPLGNYSQAEKRNKELPEFDPSKKYITIFAGDYDAASWTASIGASRWQDSSRGQIPIAWAFNPNLAERIPMFFDWVHQTATEKDIFVAGDSGAGYINPSLLVEGKRQHSNLPSGLKAWSTWCKKWYGLFDLTISGFVLDGCNNPNLSEVKRTYAAFSPDGIMLAGFPEEDYGFQLINRQVPLSGMPTSYLCSVNDYFTPEECTQNLLSVLSKERDLPFWPIKTNISSPTLICEYIAAAQEQDPSIEVLDMYTYFAMIREQLQKGK